MTFHHYFSASEARFLKLCTSYAIAVALLMAPRPAKAQGGLDGTFSVGTGTNQPVEAIAVQPDGKILIGGGFTFYNGVASPCLARLNADGTRDASFDVGTGADGVVRKIIVRPDGKILIAGDFTNYNGIAMGRLALLEPNGSLNPAFINYGGADGPILAMAIDPEGLIVVGGDFQSYQNEERNGMARIYPDGLIDLSFDPGAGPDGLIYTIFPHNLFPYTNETRYLVGGDFEHFRGEARTNVATLSNTGDLTFGLGHIGSLVTDRVNEILRISEDSILVGGSFSDWNSSDNLRMYDHVNSNFLYEWNEGAGADGPVFAIALDAHGGILVGGGFEHYNGVARHGIARIRRSGDLDPTFDPGSGINNSSVRAIAEEPDEMILIGGGFSQYNGDPVAHLARLCPATAQNFYPDVDGDGMGAGTPVPWCGSMLEGHVQNNADACPTIFGTNNSHCDDGYAATMLDHLDNCQCVGQIPIMEFPFTDSGSGSGSDVISAGSFISKWWNSSVANVGDPTPSYYISDDLIQGTTHHYPPNSQDMSHLYFPCSFPASADSIEVSFDWMGMGRHNKAYLALSYEPEIPGLYVNIGLGSPRLVDQLYGRSTWGDTSFVLPQSAVGQRGYLKFTWRVFPSSPPYGEQPPAAIDNIHICAHTTWYGDADADGLGDPSVSVSNCGELVPGYVTNAEDDCPMVPGKVNSACDDGDPNTVTDVVGADCICRGTGLPWNEDFSAHDGGFTTLNDAANKWYWSGASNGRWYVSGDAGVSTDLVPGAVSVSHLMHDIPPIPATAATIQLRIKGSKPTGPSTYRMKVWVVPQGFTPTAGTAITATGIAPSGRVLLADLTATLTLTGYDQTMTLPSAYAGTSPRLIFEWVNDGATGGQLATHNGASIEEIHLCAKGPGFGDSDVDGILDCMDQCPNLPVAPYTACDDGDPETLNDVYGTDCVCRGTSAFTEGQLVVLQVGGLDDNSIDNGKPISLKQISTDGYITQIVEIPHEGADAMITTNNYTRGMLGLSADSTQLIFAGYQVPRNPNASPEVLSAALAPRRIAKVGSGGVYQNLVTSPSLFDGMVIRGAAASGNNAWGIGNGEGLNYFGPGPTADVTDDKSDFRYAAMFNGQLYVSSGSSSGTPPHEGVFAVGSGTPTTSGQSLTAVANTDHIGTGAFCFSPDGHTLYVALNITGIQKWVNNGSWELAYTMTFSGGANGLVADFAQDPPVLYFTTTSGDKLMSAAEPGTGSGNVPITPVLLRNAPAATLFRGLAWAPKHPCIAHTWYADAEGDGLGDPAVSLSTTCGGAPAGYVADNTDSCPAIAGKVGSPCDDGNVDTNNDVVGSNCTCAGTFCPIPVFIPSSGTQTVCSGSAMNLGSPAASNTGQSSYTWSGQGPIVSPNAPVYNTATVYPTPPPGEYVNYRTATNGCGSATYTLVSTVVDATVTISGPSEFCSNTGGVLTSSPGSSYSWYLNNAALNYHEQSIWVNTPGNWKVQTVTNNGNCNFFSNTFTTTVLAPPVVSCGSYGPLCSNGANINLGGSPAGGVWSGVGVIGPNAQGIYRFTPGVGTRTLTYTYVNGSGCSNSCTTTINVQQATTWYADTDGDGFGDPAASSQLCGLPGVGWTTDQTDDCPTVFGKIGSACDDGSSSTIGDVLSASCVCQGVFPMLAARVFLQGPYDSGTGLMSDALRILPGFPLSQPYTALGYSGALNETGSISPSVLSVSGNDAIVDWVVVELRSPAAPASILDMRAALLQRDGDIVDIDGVSPVPFPGASGSYHVAVRHRNHLGCMTNAAVTFGTTPLVVDFTSPATATWGTNARMTSGSVMLLYMGDGNANGQVKYTGSGNDRDPILVTVGSTTPNNTVNGYSGSDTNMNGQVKYTGSGNDRDPILLNVGSITPNNTRTQQLP